MSLDKYSDGLVSITQLAKLRGVTSETLRHYDRIGLLKPDYINEHGVRYYSIQKYEILGTIRELKECDISLSELKEYFNDRNFMSSYELLQKQKQLLHDKLKELNEISNQVDNKIEYMNSIKNLHIDNNVHEMFIPQRQYISSHKIVRNEMELAYEVIKLEALLNETEKYLPIYATSRYAGIIKLDSICDDEYMDAELLVEINSELQKDDILTLLEGNYCCVYSRGSFWHRKEAIEKLLKYISDNNYSIDGDIIQKVIVDYTITDDVDERVYEFQVKVHK